MSNSRFARMVGRRLRLARLSLGLDQSSFAQEIGTDLETYQTFENGRALPDLELLAYTARIVGRSIDYLLTGRQFDPND